MRRFDGSRFAAARIYPFPNPVVVRGNLGRSRFVHRHSNSALKTFETQH